MASNGVNLDALIPREDLAVGEGLVSGTQGEERLSITHFVNKSFFASALRKPEFQRETLHWTPNKIADLIEAFLDRRLIPAVILWRAGNFNFVVDGAHRLSALLAWILDDYGDKDRSKKLFGPYIPPEQMDMASKTRILIEKRVGKYSLFEAGLDYPSAVNEITTERISNLSVSHFIAQWVPAATKEAAEASFFKINDAATPLEPTEKRILETRDSAGAIASRAIAHGGKGYPYWSAFATETKNEIVAKSDKIYTLLYKPPLAPNGAIDTLDVPVAGRGYSILPFVFDLVNTVNATRVADSTSRKKPAKDKVSKDEDGSTTNAFLSNVLRTVNRVAGKEATSLGLHPVIYFYTRGGTFSPWSFLAWTLIVNELFAKDLVVNFCDVRLSIEKFLIEHKWAMTEIIHKNGSGHRSTPWLTRYWREMVDNFISGKIYAEVETQMQSGEFAFLQHRSPIFRLAGERTNKRISASTRTAAIWDSALPGAPRCHVCACVWHRNSIHGDHIVAIRDGGDGRPSNAGIAHPYCDSTYKDFKARRP